MQLKQLLFCCGGLMGLVLFGGNAMQVGVEALQQHSDPLVINDQNTSQKDKEEREGAPTDKELALLETICKDMVSTKEQDSLIKQKSKSQIYWAVVDIARGLRGLTIISYIAGKWIVTVAVIQGGKIVMDAYNCFKEHCWPNMFAWIRSTFTSVFDTSQKKIFGLPLHLSSY